jgi:hypothetical protein
MNPKIQAFDISLKPFIKFHLFLVLRILLIIFAKSFPNKNVFQDYFFKDSECLGILDNFIEDTYFYLMDSHWGNS